MNSEKESIFIPKEIFPISEGEDDLLQSICPKSTNQSIPLSKHVSKTWTDPIQPYEWTTLSECVDFIVENGCNTNCYLYWMRRTLNLLSSTATREQLDHILDGYSDLYELVFHVLTINEDDLITQEKIREYRGCSIEIDKEKRSKNIAFIIYNSDNNLFTVLYANRGDGYPQTCFASDDERILDSITLLFRQWNLEKQTESQSNDIFQNLPILHTLIPDDTLGTVQNVCDNLENMIECLDRAKRLSMEMDDTPSSETGDPRPPSNDIIEEGKLISKHSISNTVKNKNRRTKIHTTSSSKNSSHSPIRLSTDATPTSITTISNDQTIEELANLYDPPVILKQPYHHRHVRMLKDFAKKKCPFVQTEKNKQRSYPQISVPAMDDTELYVRVRAVTENKHPHPSMTVACKNMSVDCDSKANKTERDYLKYDLKSYDPELECVYLSITDEERIKRRKSIKVYLFKWKQYGPTNEDIIARENLRLCRLEYYFCIHHGSHHYRLVSSPSYTSLIEESFGSIVIDKSRIEPKKLCVNGGEKVILPLNISCPKRGVTVECNGDKLKHDKFTTTGKQISFTSPAKSEECDDLHLVIKKTEYKKDSLDQEINELFDDYLPYISHGQCTHVCLETSNS